MSNLKRKRLRIDDDDDDDDSDTPKDNSDMPSLEEDQPGAQPDPSNSSSIGGRKSESKEKLLQLINGWDSATLRLATQLISDRIQLENLKAAKQKFGMCISFFVSNLYIYVSERDQRVKVRARDGSWFYGVVTNFYSGKHSNCIQVLIDGRKRAQPVGVQYVVAA
jgi:hypothetical protein